MNDAMCSCRWRRPGCRRRWCGSSEALGITTLEELRDTWTYGNRQLLTDYLGESPVRFAMYRPAPTLTRAAAATGPGESINLGAAGRVSAAGPAREGAGALGVAAQAAGRGAAGHRPGRSARGAAGGGGAGVADRQVPGGARTRASAGRAWRSPRWPSWSSTSRAGRRKQSGGLSSSSTGRARRSTACPPRRGRPSPRPARR